MSLIFQTCAFTYYKFQAKKKYQEIQISSTKINTDYTNYLSNYINYMHLSTLIRFLLTTSSHTNLLTMLFYWPLATVKTWSSKIRIIFYCVCTSNETYVEADITSIAFNLNILAIQLMFKLYIMKPLNISNKRKVANTPAIISKCLN